MRSQRIIPVFFSILISFFSITEVYPQDIEGWTAPPLVVAKLSGNGNMFNYKEENIKPYKLPDVLHANGISITTADQWNKSGRPAIIELFRNNIYGRVPTTSYTQKYKIINDSIIMDGIVHQKMIDIEIISGLKSLTIHLYIYTPVGAGKSFPAFLLIDNFKSSTDPKTKSDFFPVKEALKRGYGMAVFSSSDIDPDNFDNFRDGIHGLLDKNPRTDDAWGTIAAWAWGASRCMDYLQTDKDIKHGEIAIIGHSRGGKTALWAGAEDPRFSMVISNESGAGGAALARRRYGETVEKLNTGFPHWFCSNYKKFNNNEESMPVDMHMLLALIAPRALYVDCADEDLWGDPKGSYLSLYNAVPVYKLLGYSSDIPMSMPPLEKQLISGKVGFHIRGGSHALLLKDWNRIMDFADVIWK